MLVCLTSCGHGRGNGARTPARASASRTPPFGRRGIPREMADSRVLRPTRRIHIRRRGRVLRDSSHFRGYRPAAAPTMAAHGTLGYWTKATHARLSLRGKARLLPRTASTVRSAILRRRDTASLSRARPMAHHANRSLAVPLRSLLTRVALVRPSIRRVFLRSICARRRPVVSLSLAAANLLQFRPRHNLISPRLIFYFRFAILPHRALRLTAIV